VKKWLVAFCLIPLISMFISGTIWAETVNIAITERNGGKIEALESDEGVQYNGKLIVREVANSRQISALEGELRKISGVTDIFVNSYSRGKAVIYLNYSGSFQDLASMIEMFDKIILRVEKISNNGVSITINAVVRYN